MNKRGHGGMNKRRMYPCFHCGASLESYSAHKRHISKYHGQSERGYDKSLQDEMENRRR
jgi:hypothetical protein